MANDRSLTRKAKNHSSHNGPIIGTGFVCPTAEQNHALKIIPGLWRVHRCDICGENYAGPEDLLISNLTPSADVVRAFAEQEGVPVVIENAPTAKAA